MRVFASLTAAFVLVASSGLAGLCFCHEAAAAQADSPPDDHAHACCPGADEAPPDHDGAAVLQPCLNGCCAPTPTLAEAEPERRAKVRAPTPQVVAVVLPQPPLVPANLAHVPTLRDRAPPPPTHARRAALLQRWIC